MRYHCRARYSIPTDLAPSEGRLLNLSDRGAGLLTCEPQKDGEQMTVSFHLPPGAEPLTMAGTVRWADMRPLSGTWHPLGLSWNPLDEASGARLRQWLSRQEVPAVALTTPTPLHALSRATALRLARPAFRVGGFAFGIVVAAFSGFWAMTMKHENRRLAEEVAQRHAVAQYLERRSAVMQKELGVIQGHLASTAREVIHLSQQAQQIEQTTQRLGQDLEHLRGSFEQALAAPGPATLAPSRSAQGERVPLGRPVSSEQLQRAIRDAMASRLGPGPNRAGAESGTLAMQGPSPAGNRGYVTWEGQTTAARPTMWIRVLDPQPSNPRDP